MSRFSFIVAGSNSRILGARIAAELGCRLELPEEKAFPNGELYLRLDEGIAGKRIVAVCGMSPEPHRSVIEALLILDACRRMGAEAELVVPFVAFSKQDRVFLPGEALSLDVVLGCLKSVGVSRLLTFDCHFSDERKFTRCGIGITNLSALRLLVGEAVRGVQAPVLVAPDAKAGGLLGGFGNVMVVRKTRDRKTGKVEALADGGDGVRGHVVFVDDMISAGGTLAREVSLFPNASGFTACATHGPLAAGAGRLLREAGIGRIITTDTVETEFSKVSVAKIAADELSKLE